MGRKWMYDSNGEIVTLADVLDGPMNTDEIPEDERWQVPTTDPWLDPAGADDEPPF